MAASLALGVKFFPASSGTVDFVYSSTAQGYVTPSSVMVNGKTYRYRAENAALTEWEFGTGVWSSATGTLTRATVALSSTGSKIAFSAPPLVGVIPFPDDFLSFTDAMSLTDGEKRVGRTNIGYGLDGAPGYSNLAISTAIASNVLTVTFTDALGNALSALSPGCVNFRNATTSIAPLVTRLMSSANSVATIVGGSMGASNGHTHRYWVLAFDTGSGVEPALYNSSSVSEIFPLDVAALLSTTQMTSGSTSAGVAYTRNGVTLSSRPFRVIGYIEAQLTTAGTWASVTPIVHMFGPDTKLPGDVVATRWASAAGSVNTTSASSQPTGLTKTFTPRSAANHFSIQMSANCGNDGSFNNVVIEMLRNGAGFGMPAAIAGPYAGSTAAQLYGASISAYDKPNTLSALTYAAYYRNTNGSAVVSWNAGSMRIDELMG